MPSITYIEENGSGNNIDPPSQSGGHNAPEPPSRYDSNATPPVQPGGPAQVDARSEFQSVRRLVTIAQVMAIVSLLIGGVVLSTAAVVVALVALRKARQHEIDWQDQLEWKALKRSAAIAVAIGALALTANIVALVMIYPMVMEALQTGEYSTLFSGTPQTPANPSTSTWG